MRQMSACRILVLACVVLNLWGSAYAQTPNYEELKKSLVQVSAQECTGDNRLATGFVWNAGNTVVTAWHAVGGCGKIIVYSEVVGGGRSWGAHIVRIFKKADLALLAVTAAPPFPILKPSTTLLQVNENLYTLGYPLGALKASDKRLRMGYAGKTLKDLVSPDVAKEIERSGTPDPTIDIIYVDNLVHGLSGAPIFDASGKVVGVADGGLENGAAGIDWALPVKYLTTLLTSPEDVQAGANMLGNAHQFSADINAVNGPVLQCGDLTFKQVRNMSLTDALHGTDDPLGLQQLIQAFQQNPASLTFSVYRHAESGATLVFPAGSTPTHTAKGCVAAVPGSTVSLKVEIRSYATEADVLSLSQQFDLGLRTAPILAWIVDPYWTNPVPRVRFDGFMVRRESLIKIVDMGQGPQPVEGLFNTFAAKRGTLVEVAAYNSTSVAADTQKLQICLYNPTAPGCDNASQAKALKHIHDWASTVLAVHLATFQIG